MIHEHRRIYGSVRDIPIEELMRAFQDLAYVRVALLFGSRAVQAPLGAGGRSDYDFAVAFEKSNSQGRDG